MVMLPPRQRRRWCHRCRFYLPPPLPCNKKSLLTVWLVELLSGTRLVKEDAAIGLIFPALFSLAVSLIARYARGVHLDVDRVLLGELAFAPFDRFIILGIDLPRALVATT